MRCVVCCLFGTSLLWVSLLGAVEGGVRSAREFLEERAGRVVRVEAGMGAAALPNDGVRQVQPRNRVRIWGAAAERLGGDLPEVESVVPMVGYRVPWTAGGRRPVVLGGDVAPALRLAAELVERELGGKGLLATLKGVLAVPGFVVPDGEGLLEKLWAAGFPVDWLGSFSVGGSPLGDPLGVVRAVMEGREGEVFRFRPSGDGFSMELEGGMGEPAWFRLQMGGGVRADGLVSGGSVDVIGQVVAAFSNADFVVAVPSDRIRMVERQALSHWELPRAGQLTLVPAGAELSPWAQDNGKAGLVRLSGAARIPATLVPRYASKESAGRVFVPRESEVMQTMGAMGHRVIPSPLLFQGGNLMGCGWAGTRVLLLGEREVDRNLALGLTREQVLEAFRVEFGVGRVVVVPEVSYHLDLDVMVRWVGGVMVALVNDPVLAARRVAAVGVEAMRRGGGGGLEGVKPGWELGDGVPAAVWAGVALGRGEDGVFRRDFVSRFGLGMPDDASYQLEVFLTALDVLDAVRVGRLGDPDPVGVAWRRIIEGMKAQEGIFRGLGWRVVKVPGFPDTRVSMSYLNGFQSRTRLLLPVLGGRLAGLDREAADVFRGCLGSEVEVVPVRTLELQRHHGAVHCMVVGYEVERSTEREALGRISPP